MLKLTIVIPTFNADAHIVDCLKSIAQVVKNRLGKTISVLVQDGVSKDETVAKVKAQKLPGVELAVAPDEGVYDAMNRATEAAQSEWIYFLGADDLLLPGFMQAVESLSKPHTVYYANVILRSNRRRYDGRFSALKLVYRNICHQGIFFPRELLLASPFDQDFPINADWVKNIELFTAASFTHIAHDVCIYNDLSGLSFGAHDDNFETQKARLFARHHGITLALLAHTAALPTWVYRTLGKPHFKNYESPD